MNSNLIFCVDLALNFLCLFDDLELNFPSLVHPSKNYELHIHIHVFLQTAGVSFDTSSSIQTQFFTKVTVGFSILCKCQLELKFVGLKRCDSDCCGTSKVKQDTRNRRSV